MDSLPKPLVIRWQEYRLRILLRSHFLGNPFYRGLLLNSNLKYSDLLKFKLKDLSRLPILNKDTFRDRGIKRCIAQNIPQYRFDIRSTSGSTGEPFRFPTDRKYWKLANEIFDNVWRGEWLDKKLPRILFIHAVPENNIYPNRLYLSGLDLYDNLKARDLLKSILEFRADVIHSFPAFYLELCHRIKESSLFKKPLFKRAVSSAETLRDADRNFIEETLGCMVFNMYAIKEFFCVGRECGTRIGFHLNAGSKIMEILDHEDRPVETGKEGNIVLTNLDNEIVPFIRYKTEDRGLILKEKCPCGSNEPLFRIQGRVTPKIWEVGGQKINPFLFYKAFYQKSDHIRQYQVVKTGPDAITIRVVPAAPQFGTNILPLLENKVREILNSDKIRVAFDVRDKIMPGPNGKKIDFVDESNS